jgi:hypothetical protein
LAGQEHKPINNTTITAHITTVHIITGSITTSNTITQIYPAHELSNRERFTPPAHHHSAKPAKPKTNMVT